MITNDNKHLYYVLEYVGGGELFTLLRTQGNFPVKQAQYAHYLYNLSTF